MLYVLLLEVIVFVFLAFFTRSRYKELEEMETGKSIVSSIMLPMAAFISDRIILQHFHGYERSLSVKLSKLYSSREVKGKIMQHLANKTMNLIIAIISITLLGALADKPDLGYGIFALALLLLVFYIPDKELDERIKKRNFYIQYDFPDFLNKLVLLVNAGMTIPRAWEKIVCDRKNKSPLYEELNITYLEIKNGKPEIAAYEDFARRCRVKEITKFITAIIQNLRKGNGELVALLKLQSNECWQLRKNLARRLGEEASTKLIFPLMIMFVGILIIVILPAIMQLKYL